MEEQKAKGGKNYILRIIALLLVFTMLFFALQQVFSYHWSNEEHIRTRYMNYENEPQGAIDVLCFGTSELYYSYSPIMTYTAEGITGYNMAFQSRSAMTVYYQLLYTLKHQTPKVVVCDFFALFDDSLPAQSDVIYRKVVDTMPDPAIKLELINEILRRDPDQKFADWYFPMLHYHSMWSDLHSEDFVSELKYDHEYPSYKKGCLMNDSTDFGGDWVDINDPAVWSNGEAAGQVTELSTYYYDLFIKECQDRGIEVVALIPPKVGDAAVINANMPSMQEYFDAHSVTCLNYDTYEQVNRIGLNMQSDFSDRYHLNALGSAKFSRVLAKDLKDRFGLVDHRGDPTFAAWDADAVCYGHDMQNNQQFLYKALQYLAESNDPFVIGINHPELVTDEMYAPLWEAIGVDVNKDWYETPIIVKDENGSISYRVALTGKDVYENGMSEKIALLPESGFDMSKLDELGVQIAVFDPDTKEAYSYAGFGYIPETTEEATLWPYVNRKLY